MKLGIVLPYSGADMSLLIDRVLEAERLGFDSVSLRDHRGPALRVLAHCRPHLVWGVSPRRTG
jgi:hypothetical protein